jgi:hypothetical protein
MHEVKNSSMALYLIAHYIGQKCYSSKCFQVRGAEISSTQGNERWKHLGGDRCCPRPKLEGTDEEQDTENDPVDANQPENG